MAIPVKLKDPDSTLDYLFDFAALTNGQDNATEDYLESGEIITSIDSVTSSSADLTVDSSDLINSGTSVRVWLSGGTAEISYTVTCRITTSLGRTDDKSMRIRVIER